MNNKDKNQEEYDEAIHAAGAIVWGALAWLVIICFVVVVVMNLLESQ